MHALHFVRPASRGLLLRSVRVLLILILAVGASMTLSVPAAHATTGIDGHDNGNNGNGGGNGGTSTGYGTTPATTPDTVNCLAWQDVQAHPGACEALIPTLSCVWDNSDGTTTAALGYTNPTGLTLLIDAGSYDNYFVPGDGLDKDGGQPSQFVPGTYATAFTVTFSQQYQNTNQWQLPNHVVSFSNTSTPACSSHPVPMIGSWAAVGGVVLLGVGWFWIANRRVTRKLERDPMRARN